EINNKEELDAYLSLFIAWIERKDGTPFNIKFLHNCYVALTCYLKESIAIPGEICVWDQYNFPKVQLRYSESKSEDNDNVDSTNNDKHVNKIGYEENDYLTKTNRKLAKLQESRAETLVGEDVNSLMESNMLVSNLQAGMSLEHPISNRRSNKDAIWRTFKPNGEKQQRIRNLMLNTNEIMSKENKPVVMDHQNQIQSQLDNLPNSSYLKQSIIEFDSNTNKEFSHRNTELKAEYRKYKKNKIALFESSALYNSTDLSNNTFINSEQAIENNCTNIQDHLNLETLLQEEKDQEVLIQNSN
ncbi:36823_t:CDS:2, partial [Gigaspora margarita]